MPDGRRRAHRRKRRNRWGTAPVRSSSIRKPGATRKKWRGHQYRRAGFMVLGGLGVSVAVSAAAAWFVTAALIVFTLGAGYALVNGFRHAPKKRTTWLQNRLITFERWMRQFRW